MWWQVEGGGEAAGDGDTTPTSARASQGIVGGFLFRSATGHSSDDDSDDDDDDDDEESEGEGRGSGGGPTRDDVNASVDRATTSAKRASEGNRRVVQEAAGDVKGALQRGGGGGGGGGTQ